MNISSITFRHLVSKPGNLKAVVSVTFDKAFVVHDIKVIENQGRMLLQMPSIKVSPKYTFTKGSPEVYGDDFKPDFRDIAHPISADFRGYMEERVIRAYQMVFLDVVEDSTTAVGSSKVVNKKEFYIKHPELQEAMRIVNDIHISYQMPRARLHFAKEGIGEIA